MKPRQLLLSFGLVLTLFPSFGDLGLAPANAQTLVNSGSADDPWRPTKVMVARFLVQDFQRNSVRMGRDAKIEVAPLMEAGNWLLASWSIVSSANPHGWAGQLLFHKQGNRWVYKGSGNYIQDVQTLMQFGVPRNVAEALAEGPDV